MTRPVNVLNIKQGKNHLLTLLITLLFSFSIIGFGLYFYTLNLSNQLTQKSAINSAEIYTKALEELRTLYTSEVVATANKHGLEVTHDYQNAENAIPLPATFSMLIGRKLGEHDDGAESRLYSPYPFPWRDQEGGLKDNFEKKAWDFLQKNPEKAYTEFAEVNGRQVLKYATADVLRESCVDCHNSHPDSPKTDWIAGDIRGVLEVELPLTQAIKYSDDSLLGVFWLLFFILLAGGISFGFFITP